MEGLVRYVYRGEVDVQPQHLQSFLKTADALKIKGLADQGLMNNASASSENDLKSEGEDSVEEEEELEEFERTPSEHSSSATAANSSSHASLSARLCEPLKVPMPNFRSNLSDTSSSSPEILPPEAKRMRLGEATSPLQPPPTGPLNLSNPFSKSNETGVPLVVKQKTNTDEDGAYPTIDYLESPKHITKVETGSLGNLWYPA